MRRGVLVVLEVSIRNIWVQSTARLSRVYIPISLQRAAGGDGLEPYRTGLFTVLLVFSSRVIFGYIHIMISGYHE